MQSRQSSACIGACERDGAGNIQAATENAAAAVGGHLPDALHDGIALPGPIVEFKSLDRLRRHRPRCRNPR